MIKNMTYVQQRRHRLLNRVQKKNIYKTIIIIIPFISKLIVSVRISKYFYPQYRKNCRNQKEKDR